MKTTLTNVILPFGVVVVHQFQQPDLDLRLVVEGLLILDDLDRYQLLVDHVIGSSYLPERPFPDARLDPIAIVEDFANAYYVIVVFVVVNVVLGLWWGRRGGRYDLSLHGRLLIGLSSSCRALVFVGEGGFLAKLD